MALTAKKVYAILKRQISDMEAKIKTPIIYRGTVATADLLPLNPDIGDMYNIESKSVYGEAGMNVAWNGVVWDTMGAPIDMSLYIKSSELADWAKQQNKPTYTAEEVGALPDTTVIPSKTSDLQNDSGFLTKIPDNYLSGTDKTLSVSGKAADAKTVGDKNVELLANILSKLDKNQGSENSGKIAGINESGDIVPMFPVSVDYNEETNCLEFGSDQKMELNKGINLDSTLTKTGYAADAGAVGEITTSLKEDISTKITKFYASSQGKTHLADSDNGKIMDMMLYGKSEQKQYSGDNIYYMDYEDYSQTYNGARITSTKFGYSISGTFLDIGAYTLVNRYMTLAPGTYKMLLKNISALRIGLSRRDYSSIVSIPTGNTDATFVLDKETEVCLTIGYSNTTANETNEIMLTKNLEATSYEPYTGGIPSPNPDYPQEIKSVVNPTVKVVGKNLLNATLQTTTQNGVTCTANGDGTYTINGTATSDTLFHIGYFIFEKDTKYKIVGCPQGGSLNTLYRLDGSLSANSDTGNGIVYSGDGNKRNVRIVVFNGATVNNILFKPMFTTDLTATYNDFEPYHEQTVTIPYTLNAIPVESGGNVTIDGQQYVSDYVDVERGKLVRMVSPVTVSDSGYGLGNNNSYQVLINKYIKNTTDDKIGIILCDKLRPASANDVWDGVADNIVSVHNTESNRLTFRCIAKANDMDSALKFIKSCNIYIALAEPEEIDLTSEEIATFKALATYYPTTNISINSEQLDGYTVFNYPISMENGWNYVKQQIGDTRDYIYDMDARTQDTDLQAAEAYVNSEYAVALTELEV